MAYVDVKAAFEARLRAASELRSLATQAEGREFTAEEQTTLDRLNADLDRLDGKIQEGLKEMEREKRSQDALSQYEQIMGQMGNGNGPTPDPEKDEKKFLATQFRSLATGQIADFEIKVNHNDYNKLDQLRQRPSKWEQRDLGVTVGTTVSVPTLFSNQLYEVLLDTSSIRPAGPTLFRTAQGNPLTVPRATAHGAVAWLAEAGPLVESDPTLGTITLNAYKIGASVQVTYELLRDEAFDVVDYLSRHAGENIAITTDAAYVVGDGSSKPTGLVGAVTNIKTFAAGQVAAITAASGGGIDTLLSMIYGVNRRYRRNGSWLMNDTAAFTIRKVRDADNNLIWQPGLVAGEPDRLLGYPVYTDPNVVAPGASTKSYVFGDFRGYAIRDTGTVRFERSDHYAFVNDLVTYRAVWYTDGKMLDASAFVVGQYAAT